MRTTQRQVNHFCDGLIKIEKYYAEIFQVDRSDVALIFKGNAIHVLINGKLKVSKGIKSIGAIKNRNGQDTEMTNYSLIPIH